ncbi:MAG: formyl transferase [Parcubacteria group bacterium Gr01-1014_3]|nr:MAG: formyl transferase [Parcubacteria group bacterium Gr01-1014_3]
MPNSSIRLVLITSNHWRHHLAADYLNKNFNLLGIVSESRRQLKSGETPEEDRVIKDYDRECADKEREYFSKFDKFPLSEEKILRIDYGESSSQKVFDWIKNLNPDYIILVSSGVIKDSLLTEYSGRILNLHLGLTPYYRGSANAFWPLASGEPECLGATVHLVTPKLDGGDVLAQSRPEDARADDGPRDISNKNVLSGLDLLVKCIEGYANGLIKPQPQSFDVGRVFRHKDYNAQAILKLKENFANGMLKKYLDNKIERDRLKPIIGLPK